METNIPINKIIHEAIEIAVQTQLRCLVKDISATLGKDSAPLLKSIATPKNVSYYLYSEAGDEDIDLSERKCQHLILVNKTHLTKCCQPLIWAKDSTACLQHTLKPSSYTVGKMPVLYKHNDMLIDKTNGHVYNESNEVIGRYYNNKIILFNLVQSST
jgi:hypothetical protein